MVKTMRVRGVILGLALVTAMPAAAQEQTPEQKLAALGVTLPAVDAPVANYVKAER